MNARLSVIFLTLYCISVTSLAQHQYQMFGAAVQDFNSSQTLRYEDIPVTWNMEGSIQADLNDGINYLIENQPLLAYTSFTVVLEKDSTLWPAFYFRAVAQKQLRNFLAAHQDLKRAIKLYPKFYEGHVELAKVCLLMGSITESESAVKRAIQLNKSEAAAFFVKGDIASRKNLLKETIGDYEDCLEADSLFHDARIKLAIINLIVKKNETDAVAQLNKVLAYDSLHKSALVLRAILLYEKNKPQSLQDLSNLILVSPTNLMAYYLRGYLLTESGDFNQAFVDFQKVIKATSTSDNNFVGQQSWTDKKIDLQNVGAYTMTRVYGLPEEDAARLKKAYACIVVREFDKSIAVIDQIRNQHKEPLAVYLKAVAYEHKGEHNKALQYYNIALQLDNEITDAYKKRGIYEQELKEWDKSIADLSTVLRLTPDAYVIFKIRGISYFYNNQFGNAISDFNMYLKYDSSNREVIGYRGLARIKNNQRLEGYMDYARSGNYKAFNFNDIIHLTDSVLLLGDTTQALYALNSFLESAPYFTEAFVKKFEIHMKRNEWAQVEKYIAFAIRHCAPEAKKSHRSYLLTLSGMRYVKKVYTNEAMMAFDEAIKLDNTNAMAYLERGRLLKDIGKKSKAETDFKQALALGNEEARQLIQTVEKK